MAKNILYIIFSFHSTVFVTFFLLVTYENILECFQYKEKKNRPKNTSCIKIYLKNHDICTIEHEKISDKITDNNNPSTCFEPRTSLLTCYSK